MPVSVLDPRKIYLKWDALTRHLAIVKPARTLGAAWTSDKVARRRTVLQCEQCWRKYYGWWKQAHYRPDWAYHYRSDCDGCGQMFVSTALFHPEESFYTVLTRSHGLLSNPGG